MTRRRAAPSSAASASAEHHRSRLDAEVREEAAHVLLDEAADAEVDERATPSASAEQRRRGRPATSASPTIQSAMCLGRKPIARSTPYSLRALAHAHRDRVAEDEHHDDEDDDRDDVDRLEDRREHRRGTTR